MASKIRKCPYTECIGETQSGPIIAQIIFLVVAYIILVTHSSDFTPTAIMLYAAPSAIELGFKKIKSKPFNIIKWCIISYVILTVSFFFLVMQGSFIDMGAYYEINQDTLLLKSIKIDKNFYSCYSSYNNCNSRIFMAIKT